MTKMSMIYVFMKDPDLFATFAANKYIIPQQDH